MKYTQYGPRPHSYGITLNNMQPYMLLHFFKVMDVYRNKIVIFIHIKNKNVTHNTSGCPTKARKRGNVGSVEKICNCLLRHIVED